MHFYGRLFWGAVIINFSQTFPVLCLLCLWWDCASLLSWSSVWACVHFDQWIVKLNVTCHLNCKLMFEHWVSVSIETIVSIESMCDFQLFLFILPTSNIPDSGCDLNLVLDSRRWHWEEPSAPQSPNHLSLVSQSPWIHDYHVANSWLIDSMNKKVIFHF